MRPGAGRGHEPSSIANPLTFLLTIMETLVLPRYGDALSSPRSQLMGAGFFGAAMTVAVFDCTKAGRQSRRMWGRSRRANGYIVMIWVDIVTGVTVTVCSWLYLNGVIAPSIQYLVSIGASCDEPSLALRGIR